MGLFLYVLAFPGGKEETCRAALERKIENPDHNIWPDKCDWHMFPKGPAVQLNDGAVGFDYPEPLSRVVSCPVLLAYIYDDDYWGYELWHKGRELDRFASLPDYFGQGSPPSKPGDAELMARLFGVEPERIARYLLPWEDEDTGNRAYHEDQAAAGDSWQMADFLGALGFDYDLLCPPPPPEPEPSRSAPPPESGWQFHGAELLDFCRNTAPPPESGWHFLPPGAYLEDTPDLPNALTSRDYALQRLEALGEAFGELLPLLEHGKYQEAIARLGEALQTAPEAAGLYLLRAFCWAQLEKTSGRSRRYETEQDLGKVLELEPDNVMALRARCPTTATSARYPRHIQDLTLLMEADPENRDVYQISRAYRHYWTKNSAAARADLEEVLRRGRTKTVDLVYLCRELGLLSF